MGHDNSKERAREMALDEAKTKAKIAEEQAKREKEQAEYRMQAQRMEVEARLEKQALEFRIARAEDGLAAEKRSKQEAESRRQEDRERFEEMMSVMTAAHEKSDERFVKMLESMKQEKPQKMMDLENEMEELKKQMAKDEAELEVHKDMSKYEEVQKTRFSSFLSFVRTTPDPPKTEKPSIAILGNRGVGKSSTCNALTNGRFAMTGCEDTTMVVTQVYGAGEKDKFEVWDVPGETDTRSYANLEHLLKMKTMHVILVQYTESIKMALNLVRLVAACGLPLVIVRNKVDMMTEDDAKNKGMNLDDFRKKIQSNEEETLKEHLKSVEDVDVNMSIIFASTRGGSNGLGVSDIKRAITDILKQDVFVD